MRDTSKRPCHKTSFDVLNVRDLSAQNVNKKHISIKDVKKSILLTSINALDVKRQFKDMIAKNQFSATNVTITSVGFAD